MDSLGYLESLTKAARPGQETPLMTSKSKFAPQCLVTPSTCCSDVLEDMYLPNTSSPKKSSAHSILLQSSITVSEDGAEVVLCDQDSQATLITPRKLSLLDSELTPSPLKLMRSQDGPSHGTPRRVSFCGLGDCQSYNVMSVCHRASPQSTLDDELDEYHHTSIPRSTRCNVDDDTSHMQQKISAILSAPTCNNPWLEYWQTWGVDCHKTSSTDNPALHQDIKESTENIQRVLRNRAFDLNAKRQRLSSLRKDLNPFSSLSNVTNVMDPIPATRSRSFTGREAPRIKSFNKTQCQTNDVPFFQRAFQCGDGHESHFMDKTEEEDMFYDSDPEDFVNRCRRRHSFSENKENNPSDDERTLGLQDDHQVVALVQEMMNEHLTLILHDDSATDKLLRPHGVRCWIERGQQLRNTIIAPKLFWKSLQLPHASNSSMRGSSTKNVFSSINLMDISRILPANNAMVDRDIFPFCKTNHAFYIKTLDQSLLFEANSKCERDRIVRTLRLVVARLGSLLLTNNDRLADEYFAFFDQGYLGPGEEPYWLAHD